MSSRKKHNHLVWVDIDLHALRRNFKAIKRLAHKNFVGSLPKAGRASKLKNIPAILPVIKADAYGHGMLKVAHVLNKMDVGIFGVSDVAEGIQLRKSGIKKPILLFESTLSSFAKDIIDYRLTPSVCTLALASALNKYAKSKKRILDIHVSVDTGMGRLGIVYEEAEDFIEKIMKLKNLSMKGIYTHLPIADTNPKFTKKQFRKLADLVKRLDQHALVIPFIHAANSMGLAGYKTHILNLARPGLMLYGLYPVESLRKKIKLTPVMSVKSRIVFIKRIAKGSGISYGHTFIAPRNMKIAVLSIGYNDGYFRAFSNRASVLVKGKKCPVVGRVTMDQIMVDVTKVKSVSLGEEAVVLGKQEKNEISADSLAELANTINYEIVCSLGNRNPRIYK